MLKKLMDDLEEMSRLFGRPINEDERDLILHWEENVRHRVLSKTPEPCNSPVRWKLSEERSSLTHRFRIMSGGDDNGDLKGYLTTGMYPSGRVGEIFFEVAKEGSFVSGVLDALVTAISVGLQHGIPLQTFTKKFRGTRFEPSGMVRAAPEGVLDGMKTATSVLDYIARYLDYRFPEGSVRHG